MDRAANHALRDARPNPHVLAPGDVLDVPDPDEQQIAFSPGGRQRFQSVVPKTHLRLRLALANGAPAANKRFELELPGAAHPLRGSTDGDGVLDAQIGVLHTSAMVLLFLDGDWPVRIPVRLGYLDPIDRPTGIAARLRNLGYDVGEGSQALAEAVRTFQREASLPVTGAVDDATRTQLVDRHGV